MLTVQSIKMTEKSEEEAEACTFSSGLYWHFGWGGGCVEEVCILSHLSFFSLCSLFSDPISRFI